jgi:conjugative transfer signal peptidase TraF
MNTSTALGSPRVSLRWLRAFGYVALGPAILLTLALLGRGWLALHGLRLLDQVSPSVPVGWYLARSVDPAHLMPSMTVCLPGTSQRAPAALRAAIEHQVVSDSWRRDPLVKFVAGVEGDVVTYESGLVHVNGKALANSTILPTNGAGQPLPRAAFPITLAHGQVWLRATHPRGFDSRYFGAVDVAALSCVASPLLLR